MIENTRMDKRANRQTFFAVMGWTFVGASLSLLLIALCLTAVAVLLTQGIGWWYQAQFRRVQLGDRRPRVLQIMGSPGWHSDCQSNYFSNYVKGPDHQGCHQISLYYQFQGQEQWEIGFDAQDRVISKYYYRRSER